MVVVDEAPNYLSAERGRYVIAQANAPIMKDGTFMQREGKSSCRIVEISQLLSQPPLITWMLRRTKLLLFLHLLFLSWSTMMPTVH